MIISDIQAWGIYDSRGRPTVAAEVTLSDGSCGICGVPGGASVGQKEALERRDHSDRLDGLTVDCVITDINQDLRSALVGQSYESQSDFDHRLLSLDGDPLKSRYGSNASLALSVAYAKAMSRSRHQELFLYLIQGSSAVRHIPIPWLNFINGGAHVTQGLSIQEFMIVPHGFTHIKDALEAGVSVYMTLRKMLKEMGHSTLIGDEGGFAPSLRHTHEALHLLMEAIHRAGYKCGSDISLALDVAAQECMSGEHYHIDGQVYDRYQWAEFLIELVQDFPILSIEDAAGENDWECWATLMREIGQGTWLIGDDLFATQVAHIKEGVVRDAANAALIKPNQVGTLTETLAAVSYAQKQNMLTCMSHRSGDTEDAFISDCAVAWGLCGIKAGACARSERLSKYNRLLTIAHKNPGLHLAQLPAIDM